MENNQDNLAELMMGPSNLLGCEIGYCGEGSTNAVFKVLDYPIVLRIPKVQELNNKDDNEDFVKAVCKTKLSKYIYQLKPCYLDPKLKPLLDDILSKNRRTTFKDKPLIVPTEYDSNGNFFGTWCLSPHLLKHEKKCKELIFEIKPKEGVLYNSTHYKATDKCDLLLNSINEFKEVIDNKYLNPHECMFNRRQNDSGCSKYSKKVPLCSISFYNSIIDKDFSSLKFQVKRLLGNGESYFIISKNTFKPLYESDDDNNKEILSEVISRSILEGDLFKLLYVYQSVDILGIKRSCLLYKILTENESDSFSAVRHEIIQEYINYCLKCGLDYDDKIEMIEKDNKNLNQWLDHVFLERVQELIPRISDNLETVRRTKCSCFFSTAKYEENARETAGSFQPFMDEKMNEDIPIIVLMQLFLLSKTFVDSSIIFTLKENPKSAETGFHSSLKEVKYTPITFGEDNYLLNIQLVDIDAKKFTHIKNWMKYIKLE